MRSLRGRLVVGLLALAAVGLAVVGAVTYAAERSFLLDRVDQQLSLAIASVSRALDDQGFSVPGGGDATAGPGDGHGGLGGADHGTTADLPPGTYGQRRTSAGRVIGHFAFSYGERALAAPALPATVPLGRLLTVGAVGSSTLHYRVLAQRDRDGAGVTIAAVPLRDIDTSLARLLRVEAIVIVSVLLALGLLALGVVRLGLRPLDRIARTAGAIAAGELSHRVAPATTKTEVGRLGLALNTMLDRLQGAFIARERSEERLRRFLADASHELRTPLASIRGYAELFRLGAAADPEDVAKAMRRIEAEAARMGVLVEDLLTLARLDAVRERGDEPVDLNRLAAEAVEAARVIAPERPIALALGSRAAVRGDRLELRRVLDNLLRNALTHTPATAAIDVALRCAGGWVEVEVRDHGTGLPPGDPGALFERFWRSEAGRERGKAGAGLGLAIVGAIVAGHGGSVTAESAEGGGARFVVRLPACSP